MNYFVDASTTTNNFNYSNYSNITRGSSRLERFPAFVLSVFLTVIGTIGNAHVLIIYIQRYKFQMKQHITFTSPYLVFVLSLAVLDTFTCVVTLPLSIAELNQNFTPLPEYLCKAVRYLAYFVHISSVLHLSLISIHCYRQVCRPFASQIQRNLAMKICLCFDIAATIIAFPVIFLAHNVTKIIEWRNESVCTLLIRRSDSHLPKVYFGALSAALLIGLLIICASYVTLIISRCQQSKFANIKSNKFVKSTRKTSAILITVSVLFVLSYVPYMVLAVLSVVMEDFRRNLSDAGAATRKFWSWFPFFNNVINPFVYFLKDRDFRRKLLQMYSCLKCDSKLDA